MMWFVVLMAFALVAGFIIVIFITLGELNSKYKSAISDNTDLRRRMLHMEQWARDSFKHVKKFEKES